jgi:hypothetical protein
VPQSDSNLLGTVALWQSLSPKSSRVFWQPGFFVPCMLQALIYLKIIPIDRMPEWLFFGVWPAFGFYMASDTGSGADNGRAALGFLLSAVANAIVYGLLGGVISFCYRRICLGWQTRAGGPHSGA